MSFVGNDCLWSLRPTEQINYRLKPDTARAVTCSPSENVICVGMMIDKESL